MASVAELQKTQGKADEIKKICRKLWQLNKIDWELVNYLIDNQQTICTSKKVIMDGHKYKVSYISNPLEVMTKFEWKNEHQQVVDNRREVVDQLLKEVRKVNVDNMLAQMQRMM